jgi:hypothetical protein
MLMPEPEVSVLLSGVFLLLGWIFFLRAVQGDVLAYLSPASSRSKTKRPQQRRLGPTPRRHGQPSGPSARRSPPLTPAHMVASLCCDGTPTSASLPWCVSSPSPVRYFLLIHHGTSDYQPDYCFARQDMTQSPPTQELVAKDLHGMEWRFRHIFRGNFSFRISLC